MLSDIERGLAELRRLLAENTTVSTTVRSRRKHLAMPRRNCVPADRVAAG